MEASNLKLGYDIIQKFSKNFAKQTGLSNLTDFKKVLVPLGAKINEINLTSENLNFFVNVYDKNKLDINLPIGLTVELERFFLAQALGHYILHAKSGETPCVVSSINKSETTKEALWFSLELLMPDDRMLSSEILKLDDEKIARLFRVPEMAVKMKKTIIKNFYKV